MFLGPQTAATQKAPVKEQVLRGGGSFRYVHCPQRDAELRRLQEQSQSLLTSPVCLSWDGPDLASSLPPQDWREGGGHSREQVSRC